ncbi:MAG: 3-oxoacyl-ACP reductase FabG [Gammaproteobacteria bacterium]|nr:MAG: 3-oxoacyl-ACP reductase FabG [Gammaproteobacteria bacterium]
MKYALVTGATGAIGEAIAKQLSSDGFFVFVHYMNNQNKACQIVQKIKSLGGCAEAVQFDISDNKQTKTAIEKINKKYLISVLINTAGINDDAPMMGMKNNQWTDIINTNLNGFFNVTSNLLMPMSLSRWGRIISISSVAGVIGNRGQTNYAASKAGIIAASKSLAKEMAKKGITVNTVVPGIIKSPMSDKVFDDKLIKNLVPANRAGTADEVAYLVSFLCSEKADYINGQAININGAMI